MHESSKALLKHFFKPVSRPPQFSKYQKGCVDIPHAYTTTFAIHAKTFSSLKKLKDIKIHGREIIIGSETFLFVKITPWNFLFIFFTKKRHGAPIGGQPTVQCPSTLLHDRAPMFGQLTLMLFLHTFFEWIKGLLTWKLGDNTVMKMGATGYMFIKCWCAGDICMRNYHFKRGHDLVTNFASSEFWLLEQRDH